MKFTSAIVYLTLAILISVVSAQNRQPSFDGACGPPPRVMPPDCCTGIDKIVTIDSFRKCDAECGPRNSSNGSSRVCCNMQCISKEMGLSANNKVDKATALKSLTAAVGNDNDWMNAVTKAIDECFNPNSPYMMRMMKHKQECDADTITNGNTAICIKRYFLKNCPKPVNSADCQAFRTFFDCLDKNMGNSN